MDKGSGGKGVYAPILNVQRGRSPVAKLSEGKAGLVIGVS